MFNSEFFSLILAKHLPQKDQCNIFVSNDFKYVKQFVVYLINFVTNRHLTIHSGNISPFVNTNGHYHVQNIPSLYHFNSVYKKFEYFLLLYA